MTFTIFSIFDILKLRSLVSVAGLAIFVMTVGAGCSGAKKKTDAVTPSPSAPTAEASRPDDKAASANAAGTKVTAQTVECINANETRVLAIEPKGSGCNLNYTKAGKTSSIAQSMNGAEYCEKTQQKIRSKLESGGYTCK